MRQRKTSLTHIRPPLKSCQSCGAPFQPIMPDTSICRTCHLWHRIGMNLADTASLLRVVRS